MAATTSGRRLAFDRLEPRLNTSAVPPLGALGFASGTVSRPGATAEVRLPISQGWAQPHRKTVFGLTIRPEPGSALSPRLASARDTAGQPLAVHPGVPYLPGKTAAARAYVKDGVPGSITAGVDLPGDANGDGRVTLDDLGAFAKAYPSRRGDPDYDPAADFNRNGQVGQDDARLLERNLTPLTPKGPLVIDLALAPSDQARGPTPQNSGGVTHRRDVTIIGKTTPGAIVFADSGLGDYSFTGPALATDATGAFSIDVTNQSGLTTYNFMAIDPYGEQTVRAFPVYWVGFDNWPEPPSSID